MHGKETPGQGIWERPILRRTLIKGSTYVAGGVITAALLRGFSLDKYSSDYPKVTPEEREHLRNDHIESIAHYAGNTETGMRSAAEGGYDYADADILIHEGQAYHTHGMQIGPIHFDQKSRSVSLSLTELTVERGIEVAREEDIGIFYEFKRGKPTQKIIRHITALGQNNNVKLLFSSKSYEVVRMVQEETRNSNICIYIPDKSEDWHNFLNSRTVNTILTTPKWINQYGSEFEARGTSVYVQEFKDHDEEARIATNNFVRGFMYDPGIQPSVLTISRS